MMRPKDIGTLCVGLVARTEPASEIRRAIASVSSLGVDLICQEACSNISVTLLCAEQRNDLGETQLYDGLELKIIQPSQWKALSIIDIDDQQLVIWNHISSLLNFMWSDVHMLVAIGSHPDTFNSKQLLRAILNCDNNKRLITVPYPEKQDPYPSFCILSRWAEMNCGPLMFAADRWDIKVRRPWFLRPRYYRTGGPHSLDHCKETPELVFAALAAYFEEDRNKEGLEVVYSEKISKKFG